MKCQTFNIPLLAKHKTMGHYDAYYEETERERIEWENKKTMEDFDDLISNLSLKDKEFLIPILSNIEDYRALNRIIKRSSYGKK